MSFLSCILKISTPICVSWVNDLNLATIAIVWLIQLQATHFKHHNSYSSFVYTPFSPFLTGNQENCSVSITIQSLPKGRSVNWYELSFFTPTKPKQASDTGTQAVEGNGSGVYSENRLMTPWNKQGVARDWKQEMQARFVCWDW